MTAEPDPLVACFTHTHRDYHDPATDTFHDLEFELEVRASDLSAPFASLCRNRGAIAHLLRQIHKESQSEYAVTCAAQALDLLGGDA